MKFCKAVHAELENRIDTLRKKFNIDTFKEYYSELYKQDTSKRDELAFAFGQFHELSHKIKDRFRSETPEEYTEILQDFGDNIRCTGNPFTVSDNVNPSCSCILTKDVVQIIKLLYRQKLAAFFVIDSIRNPYEVIYLRNELANFLLLSIYDDKLKRRQRYIEKAKSTWKEKTESSVIESVFEKADYRDSGQYIKESKESLYKQNVTKCVQISDLSINNDIVADETERRYKIFKKILRFICLILSPGCAKPNDDEVFMNMAYTMAVKSNCISRQVGAVVIGPDGYVLGAGWNDVATGKISCGLRTISDLKNTEEFQAIVNALKRSESESREEVVKRLKDLFDTNEILAEQCCFCFKDEMVKKDVLPKLNKAWQGYFKGLSEKQDEGTPGFDIIKQVWGHVGRNGESVVEYLTEKGHLHQLEYCLALHAEENAILQSSKIGGAGLKNGVIYSTAEPCTLCAKKIKQVGIKKVVYTDPYPKSLAEIYRDKVKAVQFEGVKPRAYIKLFMPHHDQKDWQELECQNLNPVM